MSHQKKCGLCRLSTDPPHTYLTCEKSGDMPDQYQALLDKAALRKRPRPPGIDPIDLRQPSRSLQFKKLAQF